MVKEDVDRIIAEALKDFHTNKVKPDIFPINNNIANIFRDMDKLRDHLKKHDDNIEEIEIWRDRQTNELEHKFNAAVDTLRDEIEDLASMLELARRNFNRERSEMRMKMTVVLMQIKNAALKNTNTNEMQEEINQRMKQILDLERL